MNSKIERLSNTRMLVKFHPESVEEKEALARGGLYIEEYIHKAISKSLGSDYSVLSAEEDIDFEYTVEVTKVKGLE